MPTVAWTNKDINNWIRERIIASGLDGSVVPDDEPFRVLKLKDVMERTQLGRSTIYRQIAAGNFPKPIHLIY